MSQKLDFFIISIMFLFTTNILAGIGSCIFIVYYASLLKINVIDVKYDGKWLNYFKGCISFKKRLKK